MYGGTEDGKTNKEKEGQDRREIKGGVDNKVDNRKSENLIEPGNKEGMRWNGKNKEKKDEQKKCE